MKNLTKILLSVSLVLGVVVVPNITLAERGGDNLVPEVSVGFREKVDIGLGTEIDVIDATTTSNTDAEIEVKSNSGIQSNADTSVEAEGRSTLKTNIAGVAVRTAAQVRSEEDLEIFLANVLMENEAVAAVEFETSAEGSQAVEVVYKHYGRLFGLIPLTIKSTTIVSEDDESGVMVDSNVPWWSFLVAKKSYNQNKLETALINNPKITAGFSVGALTRAEVAEAVIAEIRATVQTEAEVGV